ncbi:hypothetical protein Scep_025359 [Stephania cephalantha]|uniref:Uncharacterized protein n=1 Tax=Stephania cephalantha TaxID=152367 RepID=A0AAP0EKL8_9MAGN
MLTEHGNPLLEHIAKLEDALYNIQFEQHWLEAQTDRQAENICTTEHTLEVRAKITRKWYSTNLKTDALISMDIILLDEHAKTMTVEEVKRQRSKATTVGKLELSAITKFDVLLDHD